MDPPEALRSWGLRQLQCLVEHRHIVDHVVEAIQEVPMTTRTHRRPLARVLTAAAALAAGALITAAEGSVREVQQKAVRLMVMVCG